MFIIINVSITEIEKQGTYTSEKVKEAFLRLLRDAKMIAETASLELVAKGSTTKEMKNEGMLVAVEKLSTASTKGSANAAAIAVPSSSINPAFKDVIFGFLTPSALSSL